MQGNVKYSYNAGKCSCGEKTRREVARGEAPSHLITLSIVTLCIITLSKKKHLVTVTIMNN
jgi:hypothetical protein